MRCPECTESLEMIEPISELWRCKKCGVWQIHDEKRLDEIYELAMQNQNLTVRELDAKFRAQQSKGFGV